ncbi:NADH:ubiquinone oxidoreductase subunit-17.2 [Zostera marina]|uniref:NADH dehydrogenase [ubiquinone] 1 alpha subcomplex subunit 12 n=1 Tax=Zostera marina TaxID=29655 RepID=A0A0K9NTN4_ZOSMR|nr:NADH:ubiquinone oxidoreductase subunit-17.2 [Zostera marina]
MSKILAKVSAYFRSRTQVGVDKAGNQYFIRPEKVDGVMKEKRWVIFKGDDDSTSIPVEWICWLNGQRKKAPTLEETMELEARRERVKLNVANLKKEEEQRKSILRNSNPTLGSVKPGGPDLRSFIQQFPNASSDQVKASEEDGEKTVKDEDKRSTEPIGSGQSFKPGTWQPPT